ncbi:MAG: hypothetical protein WC718_14720 [Phycisphaerales bacterium]
MHQSPTIPTPPDSGPPSPSAGPGLSKMPKPDAEDLAAEGEREEVAVQTGIVSIQPPVRLSLSERVSAMFARLSSRNHFWHRVCSMIWLPYAFKSGIRMKKVDDRTFAAELPFRRFNRNWYNAMAGASLLANSEIAGGMYIFARTGGDYTLVCKELGYRFLRPCFGPALYKVTPREDLEALIAKGKEFNLTLDLEIIQQALLPEAVAKKRSKDTLLAKLAAKERRVGRCVATFHLTPSLHQKAKRGSARAVGAGSDFAKK